MCKGIPDNDCIDREQLGVRLTRECNYKCPWCCRVPRGKAIDEGEWNDDTVSKFRDHLKKYRYQSFQISGGEPMLRKSLLMTVCNVIREYCPGAGVNVSTNGVYADKDIIAQLNAFGASLTVSLQGEGYKGIQQMIFESPLSAMVVGVIAGANNLRIRTVMSPKYELAKNAIFLHAVFPAAKIAATYDYTLLSQLRFEDFLHLRREIGALREKAGDFSKWLEIVPSPRGQTRLCCCAATKRVFDIDGSVGWVRQYPEIPASGCAFFREEMGDEMYELYSIAVYRDKPGK